MSKICVLFDATALENSLTNKMLRTGVYFAVYNMIAEMARRDDVELLFFTHKKRLLRRYIREHAAEFAGIPVFDDPALIDGGVDVYFSAWYPLCDWIREYFPAVSCYSVLYDIIGIVHPEYLLGMKLPAMWRVLNDSAINDHYFAISQHTKNDIVRMGRNFDPDRITVIPLAANAHFHPNVDAVELGRVKKKYGIPKNRRYILSLCSLEPRKNLVSAAAAFVEFVEKNDVEDLVFVLAGNAWPQFREEMRRHVAGFGRHADKLVTTGYVDDQDVSTLYSNALWFVYTSRYEGFGLPPLEAMQCGCPVITSNNTSLPEVVGDSGLLVDSMDIGQHVAAYEAYYRRPELREENARKGVERARLFSWDRCVEIICSRMHEDAARKRNKPKISFVMPVNHADRIDDLNAAELSLASVQAQQYSEKEILLLDCGHDPAVSSQFATLAAATGATMKTIPDSSPFRACNTILPDLTGEYAVFLEAGAHFPKGTYFSVCVAKSVECDADLSYTDSLTPAGEVNCADIEKIALGNHFQQSAALLKMSTLRQVGGFSIEYGFSAFNELMMRMLRDRRKIARIRHMPMATTTTIDAKAPVDEYSAAFFANFGTETTLSPDEFREIYSGDCLKTCNDSRLMNLAGKLPYAVGGWAICKEMIYDRHMGEILDKHAQETEAASRHFLLGFLPVSRTFLGDSLRSVAAYRWRGMSLIKTIARGAQTFSYLFSLIPLFSRKRK